MENIHNTPLCNALKIYGGEKKIIQDCKNKWYNQCEERTLHD
jgi:hypothetical protein